ncbi:MAG: hypothetical protein ACTSQJ_17375 [Promethearchaeota archaeon]
MKKFIYIVTILGIFFLPLITLGTADTADWLAIQENHNYGWSVSWDEDAIDTWDTDGGDSFLDFSNTDLEGIKVEVKTISISGDTATLDAKLYMTSNLAGNDWTLDSEGYIEVYDGDGLDNDTLGEWLYGGPYFISTNIDWKDAAAGLILEILDYTYVTGVVVEYDDNEVKITTYLSITPAPLVEEMKWDSDGVLDSYDFSYKDETMCEIAQIEVAQPSIPGYPVFLVLAFSVISILGIVLIQLRKMR